MSLHDAREELRYLLNRGYRKKTAVEFISNHYELTRDERNLLVRTTFSDEEGAERRTKALSPNALSGRRLLIDTYNVLITLEVVLEGDPLVCDDDVIRDDAGVFGTYEISESTYAVLEKLVEFVRRTSPASIVFLIDKDVSHSGELASLIRSYEWPADIDTVLSSSVDHDLKHTEGVVATGDSAILRVVDEYVDIPKYFLFSW
ncbi:MAG TPA: DUF434 domain-containing protein [Methanomicrobia archaeon]|nr:DUF434 domain-containing protein [Methanomicrobia archaeon]